MFSTRLGIYSQVELFVELELAYIVNGHVCHLVYILYVVDEKKIHGVG